MTMLVKRNIKLMFACAMAARLAAAPLGPVVAQSHEFRQLAQCDGITYEVAVIAENHGNYVQRTELRLVNSTTRPKITSFSVTYEAVDGEKRTERLNTPSFARDHVVRTIPFQHGAVGDPSNTRLVSIRVHDIRVGAPPAKGNPASYASGLENAVRCEGNTVSFAEPTGGMATLASAIEDRDTQLRQEQTNVQAASVRGEILEVRRTYSRRWLGGQPTEAIVPEDLETTTTVPLAALDPANGSIVEEELRIVGANKYWKLAVPATPNSVRHVTTGRVMDLKYGEVVGPWRSHNNERSADNVELFFQTRSAAERALQTLRRLSSR